MLYVTTSNQKDIYTANHALCRERDSDGGVFVPFKLPQLDGEDAQALSQGRFSFRVSWMLNRLLGCRLDPWEVEFAIGRKPVRLHALSRRVVLVEVFHNPDRDFARLTEELLGLVRRDCPFETVTSWAKIAITMAVMGAVLIGQEQADIAVAADDLTDALAASYLKDMGFPVGNIILGCREDSGLWDLIHRGELPGKTGMTGNLERLVYASGGVREVQQYRRTPEHGYAPSQTALNWLQARFWVSVVGSDRIASTIPNVFSTSGKAMGPDTALGCCALWDYRTATGGNRPGLVLARKSPLRDARLTAAVLGISQEQLAALE